jgi:SPP1 family predicted phage head-tail adaptor
MAYGAAKFSQRVRFERRIAVHTDASGNALPVEWTEVLTVWASLKPQFGREAMEAGRLESTVRAVLTIRKSAEALNLTTDDRVMTLRQPHQQWTWAIRTITPSADNREIELTLEHNVAE